MTGTDTYTRKAILGFLVKNGYREPNEEDDFPIDSSFDKEQLQWNALGISYEKISRTKNKQPAMYLTTGLISAVLFMVGFALLFIDPYTDYINLSSSIYIVWCLCCLSMFFTNKIALEEWKKRHGQKKKR